MRGRGGLLAALGAIVVVAVVAALLLLDDDTDRGVDVALVDGGRSESERPDAPVVATDASSPSRIDVPDISPREVDEAPAARRLPASYRAALSKVIGRVVLDDGTPVTDTAVMIGGGSLANLRVPRNSFLGDDALLDSEPLLDVVAGEARTDGEGRFEMTDVEPRTIGALMLDPGGPRAFATLLPKTPISGETVDLGDIVLPAGIRFVGRVVDAAGEPVPNARVRALELPPFPGIAGIADVRDGSAFVVDDDGITFFYRPPKRLTRLERYLPIPTAVTDEDGAFVLERVPKGMISVLVDRIDMVPLMHGPVPSGAPGSERDVGELTMDAGAPIVGRVVDIDGEPIAGAEVLAGNEIGGFVPVSILKGSVTSDEDGRFSVPGISERPARVAARSPEREAFVVSEQVFTSDGEIVVVVPEPRRITAVVTDELTGEPVSGVTFFGRSLPDVDADDLPAFLKPPSAMPTDADEEAPGSYRLEALDPVVWELAAVAPGYGTDVDTIDLRDGARERIEFRLTPGAGLDVVVKTAVTDQPVEHAMVDLFDAREDFPIQAARTDADGVARFADVPPGEVRMLVTHPAYAVREVETEALAGERSEELVLLERGATVRGSVLDGGRVPDEPMMVSLSRDDRDAPEFSDALMPKITYTDRDGGFAFFDVDPGEVDLQARPMLDQGLGPTAFGMMMSQSPLAEQELTVTAGEEQEVTLLVGSGYDDIETGRLAGRLLVNGAPPDGWSVFVWGKIRRSATVAPDGTFDLGVVAAGDVDMQFSAHGMNFMSRGVADTRTVTVEVGEQKWIDVSLQVGSVSGRVVSSEDGTGVEGIRVFAQPVDGSGRFWGRAGAITASDGTFLIDPVAADEYTLGAWAEGYASSSTEPFEVSEFGRTSGVRLVVTPAVRVAGTVIVQGLDEGPSFMRLVAQRVDGGEGGDSAWIDRESGEFEFDRLSPGQWRISLATELDEEAFEPITIDVLEPRDDLELVYNYTPPPPQQDAGELTDEAKEQLIKLGYSDSDG